MLKDFLNKYTKKSPETDQTPTRLPDHLSLPDKAHLLISELVKPLDQPNQDIINDILDLIISLHNHPNPNIDEQQLVNTSKLLLEQLVAPISNPNQHIISELLNIILTCAQKKDQMPQNIQRPTMQTQNQISPAPQNQGPSSSPVPTQSQTSAAQPETKDTPKSPVSTQKPPEQEQSDKPSSAEYKPDKRMMGLLMDQLKEIVSITNALNTKLKETTNKTTTRIDALSERLDEIEQQTQQFNKQLSDIQKNMDKFIGLYEVVTNQYNPFVEVQKTQQAKEHQEQYTYQQPQQRQQVQKQESPPVQTQQPTQTVKSEEERPSEPQRPIQTKTDNTSTPSAQQTNTQDVDFSNIHSLQDLIKALKQIPQESFNSYKDTINRLLPTIDATLPKYESDSESYIKGLMKIQIMKKVNKTP